MAAPALTIGIQTRFSDLDPLGHVNNVAYLSWMETARARYMSEHAGPLRGSVLVARTECDHLREVPSSTREVDVVVQAQSVGRTSFVLRHDVTDAGQPVAVGRVVLVAVDGDRRPRAITDEERTRLLGGQQPGPEGPSPTAGS